MLRIIPYVLVLLGCTYHSSSSPTPPGAGRKALAARQSPPPGDTLGDSGPGVSSKVWIPIVAVSIALVIIMVAFKTSLRDKVFRWRRRNPTTTVTPAVETSAVGPAVTGAGGTSAPTSATSQTPSAQRRRRQRRTASQRSTRSLPAYNEEPGDEEMVLVRRREQEEAIEEDESEPDAESNNLRSYANTTQDTGNESSLDVTTPFLQTSFMPDNDHSPAHSRNHSAEVNARPSMDTIASGSTDAAGSGDSHQGLLASSIPEVDLTQERGAAPSYFEVVEKEDARRIDLELGGVPSTSSNGPAQETTQPQTKTKRLSALRNLFSSNSRHGHTSSASSATIIPTRLSTIPDVPIPLMRTTQPSSSSADSTPTSSLNGTVDSRHRPSASTSTLSVNSPSLPALILSRSRSPGRRGTNASSSTTSTTSSSFVISAPLTHTLTRTEFSYPKSGPTPQQLAFVSSRDSLGKWGVPFGEDAQRAARIAATTPEPPDFPPPPFPDESGTGASSSSAANTSVTSDSSPNNLSTPERSTASSLDPAPESSPSLSPSSFRIANNRPRRSSASAASYVTASEGDDDHSPGEEDDDDHSVSGSSTHTTTTAQTPSPLSTSPASVSQSQQKESPTIVIPDSDGSIRGRRGSSFIAIPQLSVIPATPATPVGS